MENKSNCSKIVLVGIVVIVASIFLSPIVYGEYKYRKCIGLINNLTVEMRELSGEKKAADYFQQMMILQCYGSAFNDK
jgi:hypothetical protein